MIDAHNKFTPMVKIENYYYINFINKNGRSSSKITR